MKRRTFNEIEEALGEFEDRIWYDRKLVHIENIKDGIAEIDTEIGFQMLKAMKEVEDRRGGKEALRAYYKNDYEWGVLNGKLSALRWVLGDDWDNLDT